MAMVGGTGTTTGSTTSGMLRMSLLSSQLSSFLSRFGGRVLFCKFAIIWIMKFRFTHHAQYRMYKREISTLDIKDIINRPDFSRVEDDDTIVVVKNIADKGKIGVVYRKIRNGYLILTI